MELHSIRVKIAAITATAILIGILSVVFVCFFTMRADNDLNSVEMMNLLSENTQKTLDHYFESIEQAVVMVANIANDSLDGVTLVEGGVAGTYARQREQTPEQAAQLDAYLSKHCAKVQEAFSSVASHTHGVATYYYCVSPDVSKSEHGFFYTKVGKTGFDALEPVDARTLDQGDIAHTAWYFTPISRGRPSWVGPYQAEYLDDQWMFSYVTPIYKAGTLVGILGMDILFDTLVAQISPIQVYDTGFACLYNENKQVVYHPDLPFGSTMDIDDLTTLGEIFLRNNNGEELIRYHKNGVERQLSFSTLENGMKLVVTAPVREINASFIALSRMTTVVTIAVILIFTVVLLLTMRIITLPLKRLTSASQRLAAGDYDVELSYESRDEVGALTNAFSQMRDHMKSYISDLNRRIYTDALTGLPNMNHFFKLAEEARVRLEKQGKKPVMLYVNLIGIKYFNRQYGFDEGDRLLCAVADILARHFGLENCCRFSQDHFTAVTDEDRLEERLEEVFQDCQRANEGKTLPIRVGIYRNSMGPVNVSTACDRAKYAADQYRGAYISEFCYFDQNMLKKTENYRYIVSNLDRAIRENWIRVFYQPIVRAANGKVCDEEALARWIDPVKGVLSPGDFIPILEGSRLIYKLDLYVLDQILVKMARQKQAGLFVVPQSLNLSRVDFDVCDIVEEVCRRVDKAEIPREKVTIELTESAMGGDFEFIKEQVLRFQKLGFQVWMDDFGSGYSSLDVLQNIHFDLIKFDMRFLQRFGVGEESKIILTELIKMAIGLGVETVAEGVETQEQVDFLREVGCTKLQGYYYSKALPLEEIVERNRKGIQIGFENLKETGYYSAIGKINLYDLSAISNGNEELSSFFDTLPMAVVESDGNWIQIVRCNKSYRDFMTRSFGGIEIGKKTEISALEQGARAPFAKALAQCRAEGEQVFIDEDLPNGSTIHAVARHIAVNPLTGIVASAVVVLGITQSANQGITYAQVAKALSSDYIFLYYVNLETERYTEYSSAAGESDLDEERHGEHFFQSSRRDALKMLHEDDQNSFIEAFTKENIENAINKRGVFTLTYRLLIDGKPTYVNMKATRMSEGSRYIIIGVSNVDAQMKQQQALERARQERAAFSRIIALSGNYICIYTVDPATSHYTEYIAKKDYESLGLPKEGEDFFGQSLRLGAETIYSEDRAKFQTAFTEEKVLREIQEKGQYTLEYRLMMQGAPRRVSLRAVRVEDKDGPQIIIGVNTVDSDPEKRET